MALPRDELSDGYVEVPAAFGKQIAEHNRGCWFAAALSLCCAGLAWALAWALYASGVLFLETLRGVESPGLPQWFLPMGLCAVAVLLVAALIDRRLSRFKALSDRPIIGGHLIVDVVLLPARATLLIWDHLCGLIVLSAAEQADAWMLLQTILRMKRAERSFLARDFPDSAKLAKMLVALQIAGWIDLHRGEEDFYYRVRSECEQTVKSLVVDAEAS